MLSGVSRKLSPAQWLAVSVFLALALARVASLQLAESGNSVLVRNGLDFGRSLLCLVVCLIAVYLNRRSDWIKRFWLLIAGALVSWTISDAIWFIEELAGRTPMDSLIDYVYLPFYLLVSAAVLQLPRRARSRSDKLAALLDFGILLSSGIVVAWILALRSSVQSGTVFSAEHLIMELNACGDLLLLWVAGYVLTVPSACTSISVRLPLAVGAVLVLVGDIAYNLQQASGVVDPSDWAGMGWNAGISLFGVSAVMAWSRYACDAKIENPVQELLVVNSLSVVLTSLALSVAWFFVLFSDAPLDYVVITALLMNIILVIMRQLLGACMAMLLGRRLQKANMELESRVAERTAELQKMNTILEEANLKLEEEINDRVLAEKALRDSDRTARAILDLSFGFMGLLTPTGEIIDANRTALDFARTGLPDVIGKAFWDAPWWQHSPQVQEQLKEAVRLAATGQLVHYETTHRGPDGKLHNIDFSLKPVKDDTGDVVLLIPEGRDITKHKQAEQALADNASLFRTLFEQAPYPVSLQDARGRYISVNHEFSSTLALSADQIIGRTPVELGLIDNDQAVKLLKLVLSRGGCDAVHVTLRIPDGKTAEALISARKLVLQDHVRVLTMVTNITELVRREEALRQSEERYRFLMDNATQAVFVAQGGYLKFLNTQTEKTLGYSHEELLAKPFIEFIHPADREQVLQRHQQRLQGIEAPADYTFRILMPSGESLWCEIHIALIEWEGQPATLNMLSDVTERRRLEAAQRRQQEELVALVTSEAVVNGDVDSAARAVTASIIKVVEVSRASVWLLEEEGTILRCCDMYNANSGEHSRGAELRLADYQEYMEAIKQGRVIDAQDARTDARTRGFTAAYLVPNDIHSMLDSAIRMHGQVVGVICLEQTGKSHKWTVDEINFAGQVADQMAQVLANAERKRIEEAIRLSEERYRLLAETAHEMITIWNLDGRLIYANRAAYEATGYTPAEISGLTMSQLSEPQESAHWEALLQARATGKLEPMRFNSSIHAKDGRVIPLEVSNVPLIQSGQVTGVLNIARDISDRIQAEKTKQQLQQTQKLEAIGTLAGGIAHDFNNILFAIMANAELMQDDITADPAAAECLEQILIATHRATDLVRQILAFSRRSESIFTTFSLTSVTKEVVKLMRPALPANIELKADIQSSSFQINADPTEIHQVLMNLCTNAMHSMEARNGVLEIQLRDISVREEDGEQSADLLAGDYVQLIVSDTGCGISDAIKDRIFEPFFTTKEPGQGTGMGLAVVHGIVTKLGGHIRVYSQPGAGAAFHIYLPAVSTYQKPVPTASSEDIPRGTGRILIVDDERSITDATARILQGLGYRTVTSNNSAQALEIFSQDPLAFDLVITDLTMPKQSGTSLARELLKLRPELPIILCTGFTQAMISETAAEIGICSYLAKPISRIELAQTVARLLG